MDLAMFSTGLIKKIDEISILCGIETCAIIYTPNNPWPEVWPSDWGVQSVLSRFRTVSELEQGSGINVDVKQKGSLSMNIVNGNGDEMLPREMLMLL
ncbi:hypothetical protein VNO78_12445 [Psophocarpus tetragonolobus]|uniref:MADS-box domain-containing protein n=1 Tax=Psophocarpus tetragonolobus TaxID=3891 RepID=A0AAN9SN10_PSOTE